MTVEVCPVGSACNLRCRYCYQSSLRGAGNFSTAYDMAAIEMGLQRKGQPFVLFGGEPLLTRTSDLEKLFRLGHELYGRNSIQTNATLMTPEHVRMFQQYNVSVGISIDGPGALNDARWAGSLARTRELTQKTEEAIDYLCEEKIPPGLIVTLSRKNGAREKLPLMCAWFRGLAKKGICSVRLHILEADNEQVRQEYALTPEENLQALLCFESLTSELGDDFLDTFKELKLMLQGQDHSVSCNWRACDPYNTASVEGLDSFGQETNCGRTTQDGIDFIKTEKEGYERYIALYHTPQEYGGCQGCRFFLFCKGHCPGTAIDNDWRNRTEHCELWKKLFERVEQRLQSAGSSPLSLHPGLANIERDFLREWREGRNATLKVLKVFYENAEAQT